MKRKETETIHYPKTLIVGIHSPYNPTKNIESYYQEFRNLVAANGVEVAAEFLVKLRSIDPGYYLTSGKLQELVDLAVKLEIREIIFSEPLTPNQERNLNEMLHCKVFDRTQLILEIFEKGAHSAEGKIQVELAMLQHAKSRVSGKGIYFSQQAGRIGTRGPGETQKEKEMQHIERHMNKLKAALKQLEKTRHTQRKQRLVAKLPLICLIGYTNAGKSTILNALTHSQVLAEDKLFATLDTTTRELFIDGKKKGLILDTVGFIQQLPHHLIEAFKSTLDELQYAHLLLEIIDLSDSNWEAHIAVVKSILEELEVDKPLVYVFNKIDKIQDNQDLEARLAKYQPHVLVSANSRESLAPLIDYLNRWQPD